MTESMKRGLRILLVEDDPLNQLSMQKLLEKAGHDVILAENGQQAVDLFHDQSFDCILMDVKMPVMNGVEATREIRKLESGFDVQKLEFNSQYEKTGNRESADRENPTFPPPDFTAGALKKIPIIAMTACAMAGDRETFLKAGMDDYLAKPVRIKDLHRLLERVARSRLLR